MEDTTTYSVHQVCKNLEKMLRHKDEEINQINRHCEYIMKLYYESEEKLAQKSAACLQLRTRLKLCTCELKPGLWINNTRALVRSLREDEILERELEQFRCHAPNVGHSLDTQMRLIGEDKRSRYTRERGQQLYRSVQYGNHGDIYYGGQLGDDVSHVGNFNNNNDDELRDFSSSHTSVQTIKETPDFSDIFERSPLFSNISRDGSSFTERPYSVAMSDDTTSSKADVLTIDPNLHRSIDEPLHEDVVDDQPHDCDENSSKCPHVSNPSEASVENIIDDVEHLNHRDESPDYKEYMSNKCLQEKDDNDFENVIVNPTKLLDKCESEISTGQSSSPESPLPVISTQLLEDHPNVTYKKLKPKAISYTLEILPSKVSIQKPKRSKSPQHSNTRKSTLGNGKSQGKSKIKVCGNNKDKSNVKREAEGDDTEDRIPVKDKDESIVHGGFKGKHTNINNFNINLNQTIRPSKLDTTAKEQLKHGVSKSAKLVTPARDSKFVLIAQSMETVSGTKGDSAERLLINDKEPSVPPKHSDASPDVPRRSKTATKGASKSAQFTRTCKPGVVDTVSKSGGEDCSRSKCPESADEFNQVTAGWEKEALLKSIKEKETGSLMDSKSQMEDNRMMTKSLQLGKAAELLEGANISKSVAVDGSAITNNEGQASFRNVTYTKEEILESKAMSIKRSDTFTKEEIESVVRDMDLHDQTKEALASGRNNTSVTIPSDAASSFKELINKSNKSKVITATDDVTSDTDECSKTVNIENLPKEYPFIPRRPTSARTRRREKLQELKRPSTAGIRKLLLEQKPEPVDDVAASAGSLKIDSRFCEIQSDKSRMVDENIQGSNVCMEEVDDLGFCKTWTTTPRRCSTPQPHRPSVAKNKNDLTNTWSQLS